MNLWAIAQRELQITPKTFDSRVCPDQYVGNIASIEKNGAFPVRTLAKNHRATGKCLLLILESPHISEFDDNPGPAKGQTGKHIAKYLREVLELKSLDKYDLILINAVQYQCSLGVKPINFRDRIFTEIWNTGGREDFINRLLSIYKSDDTLVNCCTKGATRIPNKELRNLVQSAILEVLPEVPVVRRNHPSFWHVPNNRKRQL